MSISRVAIGKVRYLRVVDSAVNFPFGAPGDQLHTQVVVVLDMQQDQEMAFGFELNGADPNLPSRLAMLATLRDAYIHSLTIGLGYTIEAEGKKKGIITNIDIDRALQ